MKGIYFMKIEHTQVFNFEGAIRGLRNPLESWDKSDSYYNFYDELPPGPYADKTPFVIGEKDLKLCQKMIRADLCGPGEPNSKFLRQIFVSCDITAPLYWWKEMATYGVGNVANSTSTMHKLKDTEITTKCFEFGDFNNLTLDGNPATPWIPAMSTYDIWEDFIRILESLRLKFIETNDIRYWKELIRLLPDSWLQTRTWTTNYAVLRNICYWRNPHKLKYEWVDNFIAWAKELPYADELIFYQGESN